MRLDQNRLDRYVPHAFFLNPSLACFSQNPFFSDPREGKPPERPEPPTAFQCPKVLLLASGRGTGEVSGWIMLDRQLILQTSKDPNLYPHHVFFDPQGKSFRLEYPHQYHSSLGDLENTTRSLIVRLLNSLPGTKRKVSSSNHDFSGAMLLILGGVKISQSSCCSKYPIDHLKEKINLNCFLLDLVH